MKSLRLNNLWSKLLIALASLALSGCFGGTVAQQLARSILIQGADKATAAALDANERNEKRANQYVVPNKTEFDDYQIAFLRSGFEPIQPQVEALPPVPAKTETSAPTLQESKLVSVEVWNLLIGDEKQHLLEKARLQGSMLIPPKEEWSQWQVAIGSTESNQPSHKEAITFLIPPDMGKVRSGGKAVVELSTAGELSIARYALN